MARRGFGVLGVWYVEPVATVRNKLASSLSDLLNEQEEDNTRYQIQCHWKWNVHEEIVLG